MREIKLDPICVAPLYEALVVAALLLFKMVRRTRLEELIQTINDATLREKITGALALCSNR